MTTIQDSPEMIDPVPAEISEAGEITTKHRSLRSDVWRQFRKHKGAMVGLVLLVLIMIGAYIGPLVYPLDPFALDTENTNQNPSWGNPMGTDNLGRDVMARVLVGGRISLSVGFAAMLFGLFIGTAIGVLAGFFRKLDWLLMAITDLFLALPILPLLLVVIMLFREPLKDSFGPSLGPQHRYKATPGHDPTHPAERAQPGHRCCLARYRWRHHHRVGAVVPWSWVPR